MRISDPKNSVVMYMHAGSANHGCEAIVRGLCELMGADVNISLISNDPEQDRKAGIDTLVRMIPVKPFDDTFMRKTKYYLLRHIKGSACDQMKYAYSTAEPFVRYKKALSIGGDNYCYPDAINNLTGANEMFNKIGIPTVLVGCSIEPDVLKVPKIRKDMMRYQSIIARESITYKALLEVLPEDYHDRIHMIPDPAFLLSAKECDMPEGIETLHPVGINVSPMILDYEDPQKGGITMKNYEKLMEYILYESEDPILLIPHVTTAYSDDRIPLGKLYERFRDTGRVYLVGNRTAPELKYMISRCRFMITARTHASIAAYSTNVPTLVVGYSVKAAGIAKDIFGTDEGYVCPVQKLSGENDLLNAYRKLEDNAGEIRKRLETVIPDMTEEVHKLKGILLRD